MAMKKFLLIAAAILMAASTLNAKTADQVRIYLNAGHGSWGPNDRPMATIPYPMLAATGMPDTCGFYESNTNLWKVLKCGATLEKMGVQKTNIMYSRVKNGPYPYVKGATDEELYNRPLADICEEVEANNMDMFFSHHSNAASDGTATNYPLFLYRGHDGGKNYAAGSYDMCTTMWPIFYTNQIDVTSYYSPTDPNIRGDIDFYGDSITSTRSNGKTYTGYLGVLRHGTPGLLAEGYFHTYQPARHRALNSDYCGEEGVRIARGICKYFNLNAETTGYIMGTVKDQDVKMVNNLYHSAPNSIDQWKPLNGATVALYKGTTKVKEYKTDNNYNGVFVFEGLEPGDYTLETTMPGYKPLADKYKAVTVKANETSYPKLYLQDSTYVEPTVVYENYPNPAQPSYLGLADSIAFTHDNGTSYEIEGTVSRAIQRGDTTIILSHNNGVPNIYLVNSKTYKVEKKISTEGLVQAPDANALGFYSTLSDIAVTADNVLVGCNKVRCQYSNDQVDSGYTRGTMQFYKWQTFDSVPKPWFESQSSGNYYRADVGGTFAVNGTSTNCTVVTTGVTSGSSRSMRFIEHTLVNDTLTSTLFLNNTISAESNFTETKIGTDAQLTLSPRNDNNYIIDGSNTAPFEFALSNANNVDCEVVGRLADDVLGVKAKGGNYFKYAKHAVMVAPFVDADGKSCGIKLLDVTNGLDKATVIKTSNTTLTAADATLLSSGAYVDQADITAFLTQDNKITKFTTKEVSQPSVKGIFAYDLKDESKEDKSYVFNFNANSDAVSASIIFTDATSGDTVGVVPVPNVKEGANTITLTDDQIPGTNGQKMNWAVNVIGKPITNIQRLNSNDSTSYYYTRAFSTVDKSPESKYFGRIYLGSRKSGSPTNGLYVYDPEWNRLNSTAYTGNCAFASNYRIGIDGEGKIYIPEWGDGTSGVYVANPDSLDGTFKQFFVGTRNSDGLISNNGVNVGSSSPSVSICGTGANSKMYVYLEDFGNGVGVYNIGNADGTIATSWDKAPTNYFDIGSLEANTNGNVIANADGGVWVAQTRGAGSNGAGVPSLIYVKPDGTVAFNSGSSEFVSNLNGSWGSGFAISNDGKTLVINDGSGLLQFFDLTWSDGVPTLTPKYSYDADAKDGSLNIFEMTFDYAGNLVASGGNLGIYSMPTDNNQSTTPAKKALIVVKGGPDGVDNNIAANVSLKVYPNPTAGAITISAPEGIKSVKIYNANGALVGQSSNATVDMSGFAAGIYVVKVNNYKAVRVIKK
jgi:hypothetical protein